MSSGSHSKARAAIELDSQQLIAPIDCRIFGGFLEHVGRAVYGGVFDPGSDPSEERGFRRDVISAVRGLGVTTVRWPGGNFASAYNWRDGVGPPSQRLRRREPAWEQTEPNIFGTNEFLAWCDQVGAEPLITANLGDGSPEEAAAWVRYCNFHSQTSPGLDANGAHSDKVKLWSLGNEVDGPWQVGHTSADRYAQRAIRAARLMRAVDPDVELVLAGSSGDFLPTYMHWDRQVLQAAWEHVDFLGIHRYSHNRESNTPWFLAEGIAIDRMIEDFALMLGEVQTAKGTSKPVHLAIDEWNIWYRAKGPAHERGGWRTGAPLLQEGYNLEDALVVGQYLASFIRHADVVKLACMAQLVNALAPIITTPTGILRQTIYHAFALFARFARGHAAKVRGASPTYDAGMRGQVPAIDVAATFEAGNTTAGVSAGASGISQEHWPQAGRDTGRAAPERWSVFLTNRLVNDSLQVTLRFAGERPLKANEAWQLCGDDPQAANTFAEPERIAPIAIPRPEVKNNTFALELAPLSLTVVSLA